jgi:putative addiction module component (TIGR02574 family)
MNISASEILKLSIEERINLVSEIWDSIAELPEAVELSQETRELLEQRLADYRANPETGSPWDEVRDRIRRRQ